jgi:Ca-activated chloride channel family protein
MEIADMKTTRRVGSVCWALAITLLTQTASARIPQFTQGSLDAFGGKGESLGVCPLKHTDVRVDIAGCVARVTVQQQFHNPHKEKIEAIYTFPLAQDAAVDHMTMKVGDRLIVGKIKERDEARQIYETAKAAGNVASLVDQERPNIFTQSVANIEPGREVDITIKYSETLDWRNGEFDFDFPMVVGPRYMPGTPSGARGPGWSPPTDQVPDANRISPPVTPRGTRAGHDISVTVNLNAGSPIRRIESKQHAVKVTYRDEARTRATVTLANEKEIPNKDFGLVFQTATDEIENTVLTHTDDRGKFFTLVLQPPKRIRPEAIVAKEIIFVIDKSGSMRGFPIETAKEAMRLCIEGLHPDDTFNLMTFAGGVGFCFPQPVVNTDANRRRAVGYLAALYGSGGTEMMNAIHACLGGHKDPERLRVVCFMTDGYVGNDAAIINAVRQNVDSTRVFSFGIGRAVNRYLLDGIARAGRGDVHYIYGDHESEEAAQRFYERVRTPVLTNIKLDFGKLKVEEVYPPAVPDMFSVKPVVIKGRYTTGGRGTIKLTGTTGTGTFKRKIKVRFPETESDNEVLAPLWARAKVESVINRAGPHRSLSPTDSERTVADLGLRYQLLTPLTSFVAVERERKTKGDPAKPVAVPVEMPEGVSHEGVFGSSGVAPRAGAHSEVVPSHRKAISRVAGTEQPVVAVKDVADAMRARTGTVQSDRDAMLAQVRELTDSVHQPRSISATLQQRRDQLAAVSAKRKAFLNRHGLSPAPATDAAPPKLDGVVTAVSRSGFVEISIGSDDGIRTGHALDVFDNKSYGGRVAVVKTTPNRCVAKILKEYQKRELIKGDRVATRLGGGTRSSPTSAADASAATSASRFAYKLHPKLRGLAERVAKEGKDGKLTWDGIEVNSNRVRVQVQVMSFRDESLVQVKKLGLHEQSRTFMPDAIIGTIDVSRLDDLARLDVVVYVEPEIISPRP